MRVKLARPINIEILHANCNLIEKETNNYKSAWLYKCFTKLFN